MTGLRGDLLPGSVAARILASASAVPKDTRTLRASAAKLGPGFCADSAVRAFRRLHRNGLLAEAGRVPTSNGPPCRQYVLTSAGAAALSQLETP